MLRQAIHVVSIMLIVGVTAEQQTHGKPPLVVHRGLQRLLPLPHLATTSNAGQQDSGGRHHASAERNNNVGNAPYLEQTAQRPPVERQESGETNVPYIEQERRSAMFEGSDTTSESSTSANVAPFLSAEVHSADGPSSLSRTRSRDNALEDNTLVSAEEFQGRVDDVKRSADILVNSLRQNAGIYIRRFIESATDLEQQIKLRSAELLNAVYASADALNADNQGLAESVSRGNTALQ